MRTAAKIFAAALRGRLDAPFGGNLAPGIHAELLARHVRGGLAGLLRRLDEEGADSDELGREPWDRLHHHLTETWAERGDDAHLLVATGKTRAQWLALPIWATEDLAVAA